MWISLVNSWFSVYLLISNYSVEASWFKKTHPCTFELPSHIIEENEKTLENRKKTWEALKCKPLGSPDPKYGSCFYINCKGKTYWDCPFTCFVNKEGKQGTGNQCGEDRFKNF